MNLPHTVRSLIKVTAMQLRESELQPNEAANVLNHMTALLGNISEEIREADHDYACVLLKCLESEESANRAKIRAETSPEYLRKREARDTKELALEMIRSLKYFLRCKEEEMRLTR